MKSNGTAPAKTDKALKDSLKILHDIESIINRSPVIYSVWRFVENAPLEYVSGNISQWGYVPENFLSGRITWEKLIHPDDYDRLKSAILYHVKQESNVFDQNYRILDSKGITRWIETQTVFVYDGKGKITHAQGSSLDVTERHQTEQALLETQSIYQTIFENTGIAIGIADQDRNIILGNKQMEELTGYKKEELTGEKKRWDYFIPASDLELLKSQHLARLANPSAASKYYECSLIAKGDQVKNIHLTAALIPGTQKIFVVMLDITDRKKAEQQLRESQEILQELLTKSSDIVVVLDDKGVFQYVSPSVKSILSYDQDDLAGKSCFDFIHPNDTEMVSKALNQVICYQNQGTPTEFRFRTASGDWSYLEAMGSNCLDNPAIGGIIINAREVSERKRLEAQLLHAQKMESIGRLAGGIAHDFNNILMGIQGYISLLLLDTETLHPHFEKLINIQTLVQSGANLTGKLLGFARGGKYELKATDLNMLIAKTVDLFSQTKKEISIHQKLEEEIWTVEVDRTQMEQVILNLLVNAWQAMPHGGDIYVETKNEALKRPFAAINLKPGQYVKITVSDSGTGMDEETRKRIFEPFFTTKDKKRGVGLGLASVYGIINEHKGSISVASKPGKGAAFTIYLPVSDKEIPLEAQAAMTILKGTETLLLVDDESSIIDVCRDILIHLGYKIYTASNGKEALNIYELHQGKIDLVVLDMIMPGLNGQDTYNALKLIDPQVKVILSSGYSLTDQAQKIMDSGCQAFIQKPFRIDDLSRKIREVLEQRA